MDRSSRDKPDVWYIEQYILSPSVHLVFISVIRENEPMVWFYLEHRILLVSKECHRNYVCHLHVVMWRLAKTVAFVGAGKYLLLFVRDRADITFLPRTS